jgi:hypothetical protein
MGLITNHNNIRGKIKILLKKEGRRFFKNNHFSKTDVLAIVGIWTYGEQPCHQRLRPTGGSH